jgi:hypothetical protein
VDEPLAVALKFGFIAVLYLFLLWVARSALRDLARQEGRPAARGGGDTSLGLGGNGGSAVGGEPRLEVVAALGHEPGSRWDLAEGATMGRSEDVDIRVEDQFASSAHARIFPRSGKLYIEDMGSTNGTYLNGDQLSRAQPLHDGDEIRIGDSEYRFQE